MKINLIYSALATLFLLAFTPALHALAPTTATTPMEVESNLTQEGFKTTLTNKKKGKRFSKVKTKVQSLLANTAQKLDIDLKDPIRKWLWYGIIALGAAVVLYILAALLSVSVVYWIAYLASVGSSVCFLIWLLKYLEVM